MCERVLLEKDAVPSIVRIVDTLWVAIPKDLPPQAQPMVQATVFLSFRRSSAGAVPEKHQVRVSLTNPSGKTLPSDIYEIDVIFPAGEVASANAIVSLHIPAREFGPYWFEVSIKDETIMRVPFRLLEKSQPTPSSLR